MFVAFACACLSIARLIIVSVTGDAETLFVGTRLGIRSFNPSKIAYCNSFVYTKERLMHRTGYIVKVKWEGGKVVEEFPLNQVLPPRNNLLQPNWSVEITRITHSRRLGLLGLVLSDGSAALVHTSDKV